MGVTYTKLGDGWTGGVQREIIVEAAFDSSYTSGGESFTDDDLELNIQNVTIASGLTSGGLPIRWDYENDKLVVYDSSHTEQADGADLSDETVRLRIRGRS